MAAAKQKNQTTRRKARLRRTLVPYSVYVDGAGDIVISEINRVAPWKCIATIMLPRQTHQQIGDLQHLVSQCIAVGVARATKRYALVSLDVGYRFMEACPECEQSFRLVPEDLEALHASLDKMAKSCKEMGIEEGGRESHNDALKQVIAFALENLEQ